LLASGMFCPYLVALWVAQHAVRTATVPRTSSSFVIGQVGADERATESVTIW
jgi:hypothetical protein